MIRRQGMHHRARCGGRCGGLGERLENRDLMTAVFVSPAGSDAGPGTTDQPWLTLQHAADLVAPGDVVTVRAGTYTGFQLSRIGTANAPITFHGEAGATISSRNATTADGINLEGA